MGLPSGPYGVKTFCKETFERALCDCASLAQCRLASGHVASQTVVILDGNVLVRSVPTAVCAYDAYICVFLGFLNAAFAAGDSVFVVFDDPTRVTRAKEDEQKRRDAASKKAIPVVSPDVQAQLSPTTDDYDRAELERVNPHELLKHRKARDRLYDAVCKDCMLSLMRAWRDAGTWRSPNRRVLTFDGVDPRGAERPFGDPRTPIMYSSSDIVEAKMRRTGDEYHPGEGDLKITDIERRVARLRNSGHLFESVELLLVSTVDTDSIAIELLHRATIAMGPSEARPMKTVLCFRETSSRKRTPENETKRNVSFACFDIDILYAAVREKLFECNEQQHHPSPQLVAGALSLLCAGWSLCGSDFVKLSGMRSDVVFVALSKLCASHTDLVESMLRRGDDTSAILCKRTSSVISMLVDCCVAHLAGMPRLKRASASAAEYGPSHTRKAAWCALYWSGWEFTDLSTWGF